MNQTLHPDELNSQARELYYREATLEGTLEASWEYLEETTKEEYIERVRRQSDFDELEGGDI